MDPSLTLCMASVPVRLQSRRIAIRILIVLICVGPVMASDSWQQVEVRPWVQIEIPPGWNLMSEKNVTPNPDSALITAYSPDNNTRLTYTLEYNQNKMTIDQIRKYQSRYMSQLGFRICMTKDPVIEEKSDHSFFRQVYVRGGEDAAVIGTLVYPGWGQVHYALVMEGPEAVAEYYESIPPLMQDHIRPVLAEEQAK
ncbi:MAG: hypothetical protein V1862_04645 [Methanobacteriota archaeon]